MNNYCRNCGKQLTLNESKCSECGMQIVNDKNRQFNFNKTQKLVIWTFLINFLVFFAPVWYIVDYSLGAELFIELIPLILSVYTYVYTISEFRTDKISNSETIAPLFLLIFSILVVLNTIFWLLN